MEASVSKATVPKTLLIIEKWHKQGPNTMWYGNYITKCGHTTRALAISSWNQEPRPNSPIFWFNISRIAWRWRTSSRAYWICDLKALNIKHADIRMHACMYDQYMVCNNTTFQTNSCNYLTFEMPIFRRRFLRTFPKAARASQTWFPLCRDLH